MRTLGTVLISLCAFLALAVSRGQLPSQPFLTGVWEGVMTVVLERGDNPPMQPPFQGEQFRFRLDIKNTNLVFYFRDQDRWVGIGEGRDLRLNQEDRSAIVVASLPAGDLTETWMLNVMRWDEENITVHLSRVTSADAKTAQRPASFGALGQLKRVPSDG